MRRIVAAGLCAVGLAAVVVDRPRVASSEPAGAVVNVAPLSYDQAEPAIAVARDDPLRIVASAVDLTPDVFSCTGPSQTCEGRRNVYVSSDGGASFDVLRSEIFGDPALAAGADGTFWVSGLAGGGSSAVPGINRFVTRVGRIAPGSSSFAAWTDLPHAPNGVLTDKPSIAIDASAPSPTYGRMFATWLSLGPQGYAGVVLTFCDTLPDASRCDDAMNWAAPFEVPGGVGFNWGPEVRTGPDGRVFVVWLTASGAVVGASCARDCGGTASFVPSVIAQTRGPFGGCRVPAGVVGNSPRIDVDLSGGPDRGRIYVTWTDHQLGSGATPCTFQQGEPHRSLPTDMSLDVYVASAVGALPGGPLPSDVAGTLVYRDGAVDGEGVAGQARSDEFLPTVAVDPDGGAAWLSFYSTRLDATRRSTNVYVTRLDETSVPARVSGTVDVSDEIQMGSPAYYGDYSGLAAAHGWPYAIWIGRTTDKDVYASVPVSSR